ncbi:hypothetical protein AMTR_s00014p00255110 [Amborella trichopoda]|uniref:Uncharacterized protein n=1 Tax=Amborella trichopoda TaxID=13333 RepID=W1PND7_AMBTC|nr:hypothetical protein AMTR_s00014p00255110 [Amborella trichopoda]
MQQEESSKSCELLTELASHGMALKTPLLKESLSYLNDSFFLEKRALAKTLFPFFSFFLSLPILPLLRRSALGLNGSRSPRSMISPSGQVRIGITLNPSARSLGRPFFTRWVHTPFASTKITSRLSKKDRILLFNENNFIPFSSCLMNEALPVLVS